ncbi:uncharacterized protein LOC126717674 isoform X2 [Quercus robur]|uniref:uncharacterized protein LOC126717674 isoform X2 n=1 Tax=Quercus robur TaxID=38942 RepID=UPI00216273BB|nr:uncharacterized protein LOC126717674 isoform X2 [Quercus robur]
MVSVFLYRRDEVESLFNLEYLNSSKQRSCTSNNNMEAERKCLNCPTFSQDMSKSSYLRLGANGVVVDGLLGWIRVELLTDGILIALIVLKVSASVDVKFL